MPDHPSRPIIKPSDAVSWASCARQAWLDNLVDFDEAAIEDAFDQLVIELGLAHDRSAQRLCIPQWRVS